MKLKNK